MTRSDFYRWDDFGSKIYAQYTVCAVCGAFIGMFDNNFDLVPGCKVCGAGTKNEVIQEWIITHGSQI